MVGILVRDRFDETLQSVAESFDQGRYVPVLERFVVFTGSVIEASDFLTIQRAVLIVDGPLIDDIWMKSWLIVTGLFWDGCPDILQRELAAAALADAIPAVRFGVVGVDNVGG
jgi:hypothetical protein